MTRVPTVALARQAPAGLLRLVRTLVAVKLLRVATWIAVRVAPWVK